jgi:hypothetical protein
MRDGIPGVAPLKSTAPASVSGHASNSVDAAAAPSEKPIATTSRANR